MSELGPGRTSFSLGLTLFPETFTCPGPKQVACNITGGKITVVWSFSNNNTKTETYSLDANQLRGNGFNDVTKLEITSEQDTSGTLERGI